MAKRDRKTKADRNYDYLDYVKYNGSHRNGNKNRTIRNFDKLMSRRRRRVLNRIAEEEVNKSGAEDAE